jgi:hypothetical protein
MHLLDDVASVDGYPRVACTLHPGPAKPGYSVCLHVRGGTDVAEHRGPQVDEMGLIVCGECWAALCSGDEETIHRAMDYLQLSCVECVKYHLAGRLPS